MDSVKRCTKCKRELPLDQFYKLKMGKLGHMAECKDCMNIRSSKWAKNNREKIRAANTKWRKNNLENSRRNCIRWRKNNPDYIRKRRAVDAEFRLTQNIRSAINVALKRNYKAGHAVELLGCSIKFLRQHLESLFTEGMNWDNYGIHGWHIDHIIPLSYFDMSDPEQQKRAWHYTNLQPLWASDNIRKGGKITGVQLVLL